MRHTGWYDRPGVRILEGRWQDFFSLNFDNDTEFVPHHTDNSHALSLSERKSDADSTIPVDIGKFDVVYFDTFQEGYRGHFSFIKHVPGLLRGPSSRFSYFNGHAKKHETVYKVCCIFFAFCLRILFAR
jgi:protein arginine N-methyltransferase 2